MTSNYVTYMTSKEEMRYFVPHRIQNIVLRDYLTKKNIPYTLPKTEIKTKNCYPVLREILEDKTVHIIYFYSVEMLPHDNKETLEQLYDRVASGMKIYFCVEDINLNRDSVMSFKENLYIMNVANGNRV